MRSARGILPRRASANKQSSQTHFAALLFCARILFAEQWICCRTKAFAVSNLPKDSANPQNANPKKCPFKNFFSAKLVHDWWQHRNQHLLFYFVVFRPALSHQVENVFLVRRSCMKRRQLFGGETPRVFPNDFKRRNDAGTKREL